jgi:transcriptional regulator with PAS, ATPase and Fis domain
LQNTGDFLWNFEVNERRFRLLTPLMDDEHRVIPQSTGYVDIRKMMPESDYNLLDSIVNERVKDFHSYGSRCDPFETIKVRLYGADKTMVWYCFRCRLVNDEDNRLVLQGSARRMDMVLDNPVSGADDKEAMLSAALSFPDVRVLWVDRNFTIQGCNQAFATDFQILNPKEIEGKNLDAVVTSRILPYMSKTLSEVFDTGRSISWKGGFMKENTLLMLNAVPLRSTDNVLHSVLGVYMILDKGDFGEDVETV